MPRPKRKFYVDTHGAFAYKGRLTQRQHITLLMLCDAIASKIKGELPTHNAIAAALGEHVSYAKTTFLSLIKKKMIRKVDPYYVFPSVLSYRYQGANYELHFGQSTVFVDGATISKNDIDSMDKNQRLKRMDKNAPKNFIHSRIHILVYLYNNIIYNISNKAPLKKNVRLLSSCIPMSDVSFRVLVKTPCLDTLPKISLQSVKEAYEKKPETVMVERKEGCKGERKTLKASFYPLKLTPLRGISRYASSPAPRVLASSFSDLQGLKFIDKNYPPIPYKANHQTQTNNILAMAKSKQSQGVQISFLTDDLQKDDTTPTPTPSRPSETTLGRKKRQKRDRPESAKAVRAYMVGYLNEKMSEPKLIKLYTRYYAATPADMDAHAEAFFDYYESVGWTVGKNKPMRDWQAAARRWVREAKEPYPVSREDKLRKQDLGIQIPELTQPLNTTTTSSSSIKPSPRKAAGQE